MIEIYQESKRCNLHVNTQEKQKEDKTKRSRHHEDEEKEYMKNVEDPEDRESSSNKKTNPRINDPTKEPKENLEKRCQGCGQVPPGDSKGHKKEACYFGPDYTNHPDWNIEEVNFNISKKGKALEKKGRYCVAASFFLDPILGSVPTRMRCMLARWRQ